MTIRRLSKKLLPSLLAAFSMNSVAATDIEIIRAGDTVTSMSGVPIENNIITATLADSAGKTLSGSYLVKFTLSSSAKNTYVVNGTTVAPGGTYTLEYDFAATGGKLELPVHVLGGGTTNTDLYNLTIAVPEWVKWYANINGGFVKMALVDNSENTHIYAALTTWSSTEIHHFVVAPNGLILKEDVATGSFNQLRTRPESIIENSDTIYEIQEGRDSAHIINEFSKADGSLIKTHSVAVPYGTPWINTQNMRIYSAQSSTSIDYFEYMSTTMNDIKIDHGLTYTNVFGLSVASNVFESEGTVQSYVRNSNGDSIIRHRIDSPSAASTFVYDMPVDMNVRGLPVGDQFVTFGNNPSLVGELPYFMLLKPNGNNMVGFKAQGVANIGFVYKANDGDVYLGGNDFIQKVPADLSSLKRADLPTPCSITGIHGTTKNMALNCATTTGGTTANKVMLLDMTSSQVFTEMTIEPKNIAPAQSSTTTITSSSTTKAFSTFNTAFSSAPSLTQVTITVP